MEPIPADIEVIAFTKVALPFGWLGNMSPFPIEASNLLWPTSEHLFQALRFVESAREQIRSQKSPMAAKMVAKTMLKDMSILRYLPRSPQDVDSMRTVLKMKVEQHPHLVQELIETGKREIIEDVSKRPRSESGLFWGAALINGEWQGANMLGYLWMELRASLITSMSLEG